MARQEQANGVVFTLVTMLIRGIGIPLLIYLAIKKVAIKREVEPIVGYNASLLAGLLVAAMLSENTA